MEANVKEFGIHLCDLGDKEQGIVHVIGPELGLTNPGMVIVCGDSHTATHGAFGAMAFGIGTSEVEHVLATQTIWQTKPKNMGVHVHGKLPKGVYAKDVILGLIAREGVAFGNGYSVEYYGETIEGLTMEERMSICNMTIEGGAKYGCIKPDQTTFDYIKGRKYAPEDYETAVADWKMLYTDSPDDFDKIIDFDVSDLAPQVSWGTNPGMTVGVTTPFPEIKDEDDRKAYDYIGLKPGQTAQDIPVTYAFFGSCTNGRLSDLKAAAKVMKATTLIRK